MSVKMYRFVGLFVGLVCVVLSVTADAEARECFETVLFNGLCCQFNLTDEETAMIKECKESTKDNHRSCNFETCIAQKAGYLLSNGTSDMEILGAKVQKNFENYSDIKNIVMEKCVKADNLEIYGPPGMCYLKKFSNCLQTHALLNCPQWEDSDHCSKVRDKIAECESVYP